MACWALAGSLGLCRRSSCRPHSVVDGLLGGGARSCRAATWQWQLHLTGGRERRLFAGYAHEAEDGLWARTSFAELSLHPVLVESLAVLDITRPTAVQAEAFHPLLQGKDTVLCAETGSGKTLAYLLPVVNRIYHLHDRLKEAAQKQDPSVQNPLHRSRPWVILAPTQDLCAQILAMLEALDSDRRVAVQSMQRLFRWEALPRVRGGGFSPPRPRERTELPSRSGARHGSLPGPASDRSTGGTRVVLASPRIHWGAVDIVVTTPTRFCEDLEHFKEDSIFPACIVMDEADSLFHGPERTRIFDIFQAIRPRLKIRQPFEERMRLPDMVPTQFVFAAATMVSIGPFSIGTMLIERFCTAHVVQTNNFHRLPPGLAAREDAIRWVDGSSDWDQRVNDLIELLRAVPSERTVIFVNSLHNCHVLLNFLRDRNWPVAGFMKGPLGRMGPRFRDAEKFAKGEVSIVIATEHGGRGIDWPDVDHVINFQMPSSTVCWIHRIGRTGRMGKEGFVTNFVGAKDRKLADQIKARLESGKALHGAFSRKRSLWRKLRSAEGGEAATEGIGSWQHEAEEGVYKFQGGLEIIEDGLAGGDDPQSKPHLLSRTQRTGSAHEDDAEGTLIGYINAAGADDGIAADQISRRLRSSRTRRWAQETQFPSSGDQGQREGAQEMDDELDRYRKRLLDSDSSDDDDDRGSAPPFAAGGSHGGDELQSPADVAMGKAVRQKEQEAQRQARAATPMTGFQWSDLGNAGSGARGAGSGPPSDTPGARAVVAAPPTRQLLNRGRKREEPETRQYRRTERPTHYVGARKGLGIKASSRVAAGRNYSEPDDDLLL